MGVIPISGVRFKLTNCVEILLTASTAACPIFKAASV